MSWSGLNPCYVGPLFVRRIRSESLANQGDRYKIGRSIEKPCQHSYVEGTISAPAPGGAFPGTTIISFGTGQKKFVVEYPPSYPAKRCIDTTFTSAVTEPKKDGDLVTFSFSCTGTNWENRVVGGQIVKWMLVSFELFVAGSCIYHKDKYTGNISFTSFTFSTKSGRHTSPGTSNWITDTVTVSVISNPFGGSSDNLATTIATFFSYADEFRDQTERVKRRNQHRDAAIYDALDSMTITDVNWFASLKDLAEFGDTVKSIVDLFHFKGRISDLKKISSMYLMWKYIILTGIADLKSIMNMLHMMIGHHGDLLSNVKEFDMVGRGSCTKSRTIGLINETVRDNVKLRYRADTSDLNRLLAVLASMRIVPRWVDLWDLVPYSFVVDWLFPVSAVLNNMESNSLQQLLPFVYGMHSTKTTRTTTRKITVNTHVYTVNLKAVSYQRTVWIRFPRDVWLGLVFQNPLRHILEGGALLVQRLPLGK